MSENISLCDMPEGRLGRICEIKPCQCKKRLNELGFEKGSKVAVLHRNIGESAAACYVKGAVIALRNEDCSNIIVREDPYV